MKNIDNKYYTPEIEEFHVGFEYEIQANDDSTEFDKIRISRDKKSFVFMNTYALNNIPFDVRVKHLNREDIESFGFKVTDTTTSETLIQYSLGTYLLYEVKNTNKIGVKEIIETGIVENLFYGTIKNKSELNRLLKQLQII